MKILKEIESSRLSNDNMHVVLGGLTNPGDQCSEEVTYRSCGTLGGNNFEVTSCLAKLSCPTAYFTCSGPELEQLNNCSTETGNNFIIKY